MPMRKSQLKTVIVLKLSGNLFFSDEFDNVATAIISAAHSNADTRFVVVAGGGLTARSYIEAAKNLGADQTSQDELGIKGSQLNASVLIKALGKSACDSVPSSLTELVELFEISAREKRILVSGGLQPGQSTNAVAALICEKLSAKAFVNSTDVDGVYTKDPRKYGSARRLSTVRADRLTDILKTESMLAGGYDLMDPIALKLINRSKIQTWIMKCDRTTVEKFLKGNRRIGTRIVFQ